MNYSFFHNDGSVENGCIQEVTILLEIHPYFTEPWSYGRKGRSKLQNPLSISKSLYKPYKGGYLWVSYPQESLGCTQYPPENSTWQGFQRGGSRAVKHGIKWPLLDPWMPWQLHPGPPPEKMSF